MGLGVAAGVGIHLLEKKSYKTFERVCEDKRAYEKLMTTFDGTEKREELSKLVTCLDNYLDLRIRAETPF